MKKLRVAVLIGGWSDEREVSLSTGHAVIDALKTLGHTPISIDVTQDIFALTSQIRAANAHVIFNALHGVGGEDGVIQGVLSFFDTPYTHSTVLPSAVAMHKVMARTVCAAAGLSVPASQVVSFASLAMTHPFDYPYVVKPINEGSSRGVFMVHTDADHQHMLRAWTYGPTVLVEKFIKGREIQVAIRGDEALGAIEIRPLNGFYDYEAKYTDGKAEHRMPAPLEPTAYNHVMALGLKAHQALGCQSISRVDFMYDEETFYLLEVNTQPGFTPLSLVPEIAAYVGITFPELVQWILEDAIERYTAHTPLLDEAV